MNRVAFAGILATATWWAVAQAAPPANAALPANTTPPANSVQPIYTRQTAFTIPFRVGAATDPARQPVEIQLHTSSDHGNSWTLIRAVPPDASSFAVRAPADGEYWFCVRTKDASGAVRPDGDFKPDLRVVVDTSVPDPKLNAWHGAAGELSAQWEISDANLDVASLELDYRAGDGTWQPIAFERLPHGTKRETYVGLATWVPAERAAQYEVRMRIRDLAGNPTDHRTTVAANWPGGAPAGGNMTGGPMTGAAGSSAASGSAPYGDAANPANVANPANSADPANDYNASVPWSAEDATTAGMSAGNRADESRPLPRAPRGSAAIPQTIPRGGIPANVVPVQTNASPGTSSGGVGNSGAFRSQGGTSSPAGGYGVQPGHAGGDRTGWGHSSSEAADRAPHGTGGASVSPLPSVPLPSVPWTRPPSAAPSTPSGAIPPNDSYRPPPSSGAGLMGETRREAGSVAWPADNQSAQPLDRTRLSPHARSGGSAVQFEPLGATRNNTPSTLSGDYRNGHSGNRSGQHASGGEGAGDVTTYPTSVQDAGDGIHFQESNTGMPYRPPMASVHGVNAGGRDDESQPSRGGSSGSRSIGARRPWMIRSRSFELNYDLPQAALRSRRVEVWGTSNGGQTWQRFAVDADGQSPAAVNAPADGLYGFKLVVQNEQGLVEFPPARGDEPDVWIQVDLTRPNCRLIRAEQGRAPRDNELTIEWEAADDHLGQLPVTLEYARTLQGPWRPVSQNLPNTGRYVWTMPERTPTSFHLRLRVRDEAGNEGEFITAEAVSPVRPAAGRIFDVNPTQEAWEQSNRGRLYQFR